MVNRQSSIVSTTQLSALSAYSGLLRYSSTYKRKALNRTETCFYFAER